MNILDGSKKTIENLSCVFNKRANYIAGDISVENIFSVKFFRGSNISKYTVKVLNQLLNLTFSGDEVTLHLNGLSFIVINHELCNADKNLPYKDNHIGDLPIVYCDDGLIKIGNHIYISNSTFRIVVNDKEFIYSFTPIEITWFTREQFLNKDDTPYHSIVFNEFERVLLN